MVPQSQDKMQRLEVFSGLKEIHKNWGWFLAIGVALVFLGFIAIGAATFVTMASMVFFGALLMIGGVVQAVNAFKTRFGESFWLNLLAGVFYFIVGGLLFMHPTVGALTVTLLLAAFYTVSGLFKIISSLSQRYSQWGWVLFSGIVSLLLGLLIWSEWPISGFWIIGLFIGIDLIMVGWVWIALSLAAKNFEEPKISS